MGKIRADRMTQSRNRAAFGVTEGCSSHPVPSCPVPACWVAIGLQSSRGVITPKAGSHQRAHFGHSQMSLPNDTGSGRNERRGVDTAHSAMLVSATHGPSDRRDPSTVWRWRGPQPAQRVRHHRLPTKRQTADPPQQPSGPGLLDMRRYGR